jgi:polyisoprenoid-binding protein YceI
MVRTFLSALLLSTLAMGTAANAAPKTYTFDKAHTQILFFVNHLGFSNSNGKFLQFDGGFTFDEAQPTAGTVEVSINTNSINMDDAKWEDHLKEKDFFNTEKFPTMTFKSTKVDLTGEKTAKLTGDLTLLGVTKPVTLDVTFNKCGAHPMSSAPTCGFSARGQLKRSEWGMTHGVPMVGDDVELRIEVEASTEKEMNK